MITTLGNSAVLPLAAVVQTISEQRKDLSDKDFSVKGLHKLADKNSRLSLLKGTGCLQFLTAADEKPDNEYQE